MDYQKYSKPKQWIVENIIHNFSLNKLTPEEEHVLSFSLMIIYKRKKNDIKTEFESFYYQILKNTDQLNQRRQDELKSKIKQDEGRGVIILDKK